VKRSRVVLHTVAWGRLKTTSHAKVVARALGRRISLDEKVWQKFGDGFKVFGS
jgi:hypothetical protein